MTEVWGVVLAATGLAISAAGTAYGIASSGVDYPKGKKFVPIDIPKTFDISEASARAGYALSDADYAKRFPLLAKGREASISNALAGIEGKTSKAVTDALDQGGVAVGDLGDNPFKQAKNLGLPILSKEQRDRT